MPSCSNAARRRVERLEEAIVDGGLRSGERVQERRLPDVRVPRERDCRDTRPPPLLATRRALRRERPRSRRFTQGDPRPREAAVGLELALARAARPDAAAEPLEVLPHAAHAREVVLELRELDLELPLRAARVLREDVEDQLGAVDDARPRARPRALAAGSAPSSSSTSSTSADAAAYASWSSVSFPLPTNVRGSGRARCWTTSPTGATPAVRASSRSSASSTVAVGALREDADDESALRLRPGCGIGLARSHARDYAACEDA